MGRHFNSAADLVAGALTPPHTPRTLLILSAVLATIGVWLASWGAWSAAGWNWAGAVLGCIGAGLRWRFDRR
jgi:hypothetical protein